MLNRPRYCYVILISCFILTFYSQASATCSLNSTAQTVHICAPADGSSVAAPVSISASATPASGKMIKYMQVFVDGIKEYEVINKNQLSTTLAMSAGSRRITVQAGDNAKNIFKTTVYATVGGTSSALQVTTSSLPGATAGSPYAATLAASGGVAPYKWSVSSGVLPTGLSLNSSTGAISGTATAAGNFNFTAAVADSSSSQQSSTRSFGISVSTSSASTVNVKQSPYNAVGDGVHDDTANINSAIAALHAGDVLLFPCGTYKTTSQLTVNKSVTVDGSGCATLKNSSSGSNILSMSGSGMSATTALTAFTGDQATTVTANFSAIGGVSAGDYLVLSEGGRDSSTGSSNTQCDVSGCRGDVVKVQSVSGNTASLVRPLNHPYQSVNMPTVRKMISPLSGAGVRNISLDGGSSASNGISWNYLVNSRMSAVTTSHFVNSGVTGSYGYGNTWVQIAATSCGSPNAGCIDIRYQNNAGYNTVSVTANGSGHNFGFAPYRTNDSVFNAITVNQNGSSGRGFKLLANAHNTFSGVTVSGTSGGTSTLALEYYSHHNTFNNCVVKNNQGHAIATFGNFNDHNTFAGCTVTAMAGYKAFSQSASYSGNLADHYTTIQGGTWIGSTGNAVLQMNSSGLSMSGVTVKGPGSSGLSLGGITSEAVSNACVVNNTFSSLPGGSDVFFVAGGGTGNHFTGNATPDGAYPSPLPSGACQ
jgi:hypothetical protein